MHVTFANALLVVTIAGVFYLTVANVRVLAFARRRLALATEFEPSISVLKPIAGVEPELFENLASFCDQDYPDFEVVFCLHGGDDPAVGVVRSVVARFPNLDAKVVTGTNPAMRNPKIANLAKPGVEPRGEIVVIADSDIRVGRNYLRALAASFDSDRVGAATCLYSGLPNATLASRLGAMYVEDGFIPSVLVALAIGELRFCLGATMAVRRIVLDAIGGLAALGPHIADDHTLGRLVSERGYTVELSRATVGTTIPETLLRTLLLHELRWARTNFAMAPAGYIFSFVTYALPFALLYLFVARDLIVGLPLLAAVAALRLTLHAGVRRALGVRHASNALLIPLRDSLSLGIWLASLFTRTIYWRDKRFRS